MPRQQVQKNNIIPVKQSLSTSSLIRSKQQQIQTPSLLNTMKEGFAFGVGSSLANTFVRSIFGSSSSSVSPDLNPTSSQAPAPSQSIGSIGALSTQDMSGHLEYIQCMKEGGTDEACKQYLG
jgi:hypothetical protein